MNALDIIQLLNFTMKVAEAAGVNYVKLADMRATAAASGRELSSSELQMLALDAQAAINKL